MNTNRCNVCGSNSLRADRALAGRIVCNNCGSPVGVRLRKSKTFFRTKRNSSRNRSIFIVMLAFTLLFIII